jgi:UDP-N-acetylenolpyruvoylglucosamine reductase
VLQSVEVVTTSGDSCSLSRDAGELEFEYRTSPFQTRRDSAVIVAATFALQPNPDSKHRQRMYLERYDDEHPHLHFCSLNHLSWAITIK